MTNRQLAFATLVTACLSAAAVLPARARPPHKKALTDYLGPGASKKLNDCRTCHLPAEDGAEPEEAPPHNPFGKRLKRARSELKNLGKPSGIQARIEAVADEDSDGDGIANLLELVTGHFPGEALDRPATAELARGRAVIVELRRIASGYAWNPFERVQRPTLPSIRSLGWAKNPIDVFIAAEHEARGLSPRPEASRATLLRRIYLDLIGLPPTTDQLHAFEADECGNAYENVVDQLLASPRYGERWGRHWMDVWRYSDWAGWGQQIRDSQPHIWHWRDWIVESLNRDAPYDRMVVSMLAADEAWPEDESALRATGYLARNFKLLSREKWLQDTVDHTAQAFLGLTLGCARCHDHMYEPVLQKEYYQVRAIFEPHQVRIDRVPGTLDRSKDGLPRAYDAQLDARTLLFVRGDDRHPTGDPLAPGTPELLGVPFPDPKPVVLPRAAVDPDRRTFVIENQIAASRAEVAKAREALAALERESKDVEKLESARNELACADAQLAERLAVERAEALKARGLKDSAEWKARGRAGDENAASGCRGKCSPCRGSRTGSAQESRITGPRGSRQNSRTGPEGSCLGRAGDQATANHRVRPPCCHDLSCPEHRPAVGLGQMDHRSIEPVNSPGCRELSLGPAFRPRDCAVGQ